MKKQISGLPCKIAIFTVLVMLAFTSFSTMANKTLGRTYRIGKMSTLKLEGKTNVNSFTCICTETFPMQTFYAEKLDDEKCTTVFQETSLKLKIKSLDCGNKLMNNDMYKALNADVFPQIKIKLLKVSEDRCNRLTEGKDWIKVNALVKINLNGKDNDYPINVTAKKTAANQFHFIGNKTLCMSDFGVLPPTAAMGMVKVKDEIRISLDLEITID